VHLTVFDVDGTLVDSDEFDGQLYAAAVRDVLGVEVDCTWSRYSNVTDSGILDEILYENSVSADRLEMHAQVRREFVRLTQRYVARHATALREIPGAKALLDMLRSHHSVAVAVATGGWRETAELKLRGIGLDPNGLSLATASDSSDRCAIIRLAERRALNGQVAKCRTYFGDGQWDKKAAADLNYAFVAVGGNVAHHAVVPDLSDHAAILAHLGV
jgi:beta-phosphoglucomutase-like phosphatase (HAD superfamily)